MTNNNPTMIIKMCNEEIHVYSYLKCFNSLGFYLSIISRPFGISKAQGSLLWLAFWIKMAATFRFFSWFQQRSPTWSVQRTPVPLNLLLLKLRNPNFQKQISTLADREHFRWNVKNTTGLSPTSESQQRRDVSAKIMRGTFTMTDGSCDTTSNLRSQIRALTLGRVTRHGFGRMKAWRSISMTC